MRFEPLVQWWLLISIGVAIFGITVWQLWRTYKQHRTISVAWSRRAVLALLLLLVGLGPSVPGATSSPGVANLDVLFLVDTTASMGALDYNGTKLRMSGAKQDMLAISEKLQGAHMGLITFDSKANTVLPFSPDRGTFTAAVQSINREIYGTSKGSAVDKPLDLAKEQLESRKAANPERSRLLFYLGDGEQTSKDEVKSFEELNELVDGGAVLGYGTTEGARMIKYNGIDDTNMIPKDDSGYVSAIDPSSKQFVPATSKADVKALQTIATDIGVTYEDRNAEKPIEQTITDSQATVLIDKGRKVVHYFNLYWVFAIPLVILLFWEWKTVLLLAIEIRKTKKVTNAK